MASVLIVRSIAAALFLIVLSILILRRKNVA